MLSMQNLGIGLAIEAIMSFVKAYDGFGIWVDRCG
jgi:hypothetical protein